MKKFTFALILPVFLQIAIILFLNSNGSGLISTLENFALAATIFTFFWGLLALIPMIVVQLACAAALIRSNSRNHELFFTGILNPGIALVLMVGCGSIFLNI